MFLRHPKLILYTDENQHELVYESTDIMSFQENPENSMKFNIIVEEKESYLWNINLVGKVGDRSNLHIMVLGTVLSVVYLYQISKVYYSHIHFLYIYIWLPLNNT